MHGQRLTSPASGPKTQVRVSAVRARSSAGNSLAGWSLRHVEQHRHRGFSRCRSSCHHSDGKASAVRLGARHRQEKSIGGRNWLERWRAPELSMIAKSDLQLNARRNCDGRLRRATISSTISTGRLEIGDGPSRRFFLTNASSRRKENSKALLPCR